MPKIASGTNTAKTNRMILKPIFHLQRSVATLNFCNHYNAVFPICQHFFEKFFEKSKKRKRTVKPPVPFAVTYSECVQMLLSICITIVAHISGAVKNLFFAKRSCTVAFIGLHNVNQVGNIVYRYRFAV